MADARADVDATAVYGDLGAHLRGPPVGAFLAEGSDVAVHWPSRLGP